VLPLLARDCAFERSDLEILLDVDRQRVARPTGDVDSIPESLAWASPRSITWTYYPAVG